MSSLSICKIWVVAFIPSSRRCATSSKRRPNIAKRCGYWIAQSRWPARRRPAAAVRLGKFRRRGTVADAPRTYTRRVGLVVYRDAQARRRVPCHRDAGLAAGYRARIRLAAWHARVDKSQSQRAEFMDGARLSGTVMLEGTTLSEGRGTTRPLELFGAPDIDARQL